MSPQRPNRCWVVVRTTIALGWLLVVWVMLWGTWSVGTVLSGLLVVFGIAVVLPLPRVDVRWRIRPLRFAVLVGAFLRDLVVSSVQVAWLGIRPGAPPNSAVIGIRLRSSSDLVLTVVAELLTLVPGSVVIEVSQTEHSLYAHVLDIDDAQQVEEFRERVRELEERVTRALGTEADVRALSEVP